MADGQPFAFDGARQRAEEFAADREKVSNLLGDARKKAHRDRQRLADVWDHLQALFRLVSAWMRGQYTVVPWRTVVLAIAGIIYFVNPFDVFPDLVPIFGYLDDAGVLAFVVRSIQKDIASFLAWEHTNVSGEAG